MTCTIYNDETFTPDIALFSGASLSEKAVIIPYRDEIPDENGGKITVALLTNVWAMHTPIVMLVDARTHAIIDCNVRYDAQELETILYSFFNSRNRGMKPYYLGLHFAHFVEWQLSLHPPGVLSAIVRMPQSEREILLERIAALSPPEDAAPDEPPEELPEEPPEELPEEPSDPSESPDTGQEDSPPEEPQEELPQEGIPEEEPEEPMEGG